MPLLFSYGTLQQKQVQLANFGRELTGSKDSLQGYVVGEIEITDERVLRESGKAIHPISRFSGDPQHEVAGTVFEITEQELAQADEVWLTSSSKEIAPVLYVNDKPVGNGEVGDVWLAVQQLFSEHKFDY